MAAVRDRYRDINVKMSVIVMYMVVGRPVRCPVTAGHVPAVPSNPVHDLCTYLNHTAPTLHLAMVMPNETKTRLELSLAYPNPPSTRSSLNVKVPVIGCPERRFVLVHHLRGDSSVVFHSKSVSLAIICCEVAAPCRLDRSLDVKPPLHSQSAAQLGARRSCAEGLFASRSAPRPPPDPAPQQLDREELVLE
ncbi:unnamed protein product [Danaus chrysippus]|uniref:(African queen) hypothetical protein n=1 Tax=Danaus chrysippus TaxID=151541 RepID=A0A8J2W0J4_9NEOP|nr:unnamed protein product [Danaus chrysippus]